MNEEVRQHESVFCTVHAYKLSWYYLQRYMWYLYMLISLTMLREALTVLLWKSDSFPQAHLLTASNEIATWEIPVYQTWTETCVLSWIIMEICKILGSKQYASILRSFIIRFASVLQAFSIHSLCILRPFYIYIKWKGNFSVTATVHVVTQTCMITCNWTHMHVM